MKESLDFIWANDHENRESLLSYDKIPNVVPRVGEAVFLSDAKSYTDPMDETLYSHEPLIVAEVEWLFGKDRVNVTIALRDPDPVEWAEGGWRFYPEYDYDSNGNYTLKGRYVPSRNYETRSEDDAVLHQTRFQGV